MAERHEEPRSNAHLIDDNGNLLPNPAPLDEAWWKRYKAEDFPPGDMPLLATYERTRPGFELGVIAADSGSAFFFKDAGDGYYEICLWNIWEQKKDPAEKDEEKQKINAMQRSIGNLSDDDRYIRIQITCLQRCWWSFPETVDLILDGISSGRVNLRDGVSCEPPWVGMMGVLRHRRGHPCPRAGRYQTAASGYHPLSPRQKLCRAYMRILTWWTCGGDLDRLKLELPENAELAETIYRRLGTPDKLKRLYVAKLRTAIGWQAFPNFPELDFSKEACNELMVVWDTVIRKELDGKEDVIGEKIRPQDLCHHAFFRHVDHQIANIGAGQEVPLPGAGQEREWIHRAITNYVHALGSWLAGRSPEETTSIWPPSGDVVRRVHKILRGATPRKRWLVACLWKTLQDNQAHHGRGALDEHPELFALPSDVLNL